MTKREFFCLIPGDMIASIDESLICAWGFGLVLVRRRLGRGRVQIVIQWKADSEQPLVIKYYSDMSFMEAGQFRKIASMGSSK